MTSSSGGGRRAFGIGLLLVCGLTLLALLPVVHGSWILDDNLLVASNPRIHELTADNLRFLLTHDLWDVNVSSAQAGARLVYFRPLVTISYAIDWAIGGGSSTQFHVTNMLLHAAATALVGRALLRWTNSIPGALLAAAYFGLHPARAESVAWISGRPDVLATLGMMVVLEGVDATRAGARVRGTACFVLGALLAFGSKETSVLLPLLVAVELAVGAGSTVISRWLRSWPMVVSLMLPPLYFVGRRLWLPMRPFPIVGLDLPTHIGFVFETLGRAGMYLVLPFDLSMGGATITERNGRVAPDARYLGAGAVLALLLVTALLWTRARRDRAFWPLVTFLLALLPTLNIVWIGGTAVTSPRFFYLPSVPFCWLLIALGSGRFRGLSDQQAVWATGAFGLCLAPLLGLQAAAYRDPERFWAGELRSRPDDPMALSVFARQDFRRGEIERALARGICRYRLSLERFSYMGAGARILLETLERWAQSTPDVERDQLSAIAEFLSASREPSGPALLRGVFEANVPPGSKVRLELAKHAARSKTLEASLRVRLGETALARRLLTQARAQCRRCDDLREAQALTAYRLFDAEWARELAGARLVERPAPEALARLRDLNSKLARAHGEAAWQLEVLRLAEVRLPGEALRTIQARRGEVAAQDQRDLSLLEMQLAAQSGDGRTTEQLARGLGVAPPPIARGVSAEQVARVTATIERGCAFPDELD